MTLTNQIIWKHGLLTTPQFVLVSFQSSQPLWEKHLARHAFVFTTNASFPMLHTHKASPLHVSSSAAASTSYIAAVATRIEWPLDAFVEEHPCQKLVF